MKNNKTEEREPIREKVARKTSWLTPAALILLVVAFAVSLFKSH
ncbi:hypothetical protein [Pandoraea commovens]|uniref:Uncharacterized protein n=1 Tax=Pandoraea commovens TaxID=2508289 RepID=A0ABY5Q9D8_9BURK|nr:hypothetical protein [Pandoraea commovens]UVA77184.1 hypothetical protein NTU39_00170 [Pandoraea commovens]